MNEKIHFYVIVSYRWNTIQKKYFELFLYKKQDTTNSSILFKPWLSSKTTFLPIFFRGFLSNIQISIDLFEFILWLIRINERIQKRTPLIISLLGRPALSLSVEVHVYLPTNWKFSILAFSRKWCWKRWWIFCSIKKMLLSCLRLITNKQMVNGNK